VQPGTSARTLLPMVMFQNMSQGPPSSLLQVAVKNSQQPVWYFSDKIPLHVFFTEDGRMERGSFLEVKIYVVFSSCWNNVVGFTTFSKNIIKRRIRRRERGSIKTSHYCFAFLCFSLINLGCYLVLLSI
jgi:hypothetical protein